MTIAPSAPATVAGAFLDTVARQPGKVAVRTLDGTTSLTWAELKTGVAKGVATLRHAGIGPGDTVALLIRNRPEQWVADLAVTFAGATVCPLYTTLPPNEIAFVLMDAGAKALITERALDPHVALPTFDVDDDPFADATPATLEPVDPEALAALIYTSGTTAQSKGVELTHANVLVALRAWQSALDFGGVERVISWLPNAHVMDRVLYFSLALAEGYETTTCPDPRDIAAYLTHVRPQMFIAVPRVWEKLKSGVEAALAQQPTEQRHAAEAAIAAGVQRVRLHQAGLPIPADLVTATQRADASLFKALRERLGLDELEFAGTGAAPISTEVLEFFHGIGVDLVEGYALSESGCLGAVGRRGVPRLGSVGKPHDALELKLAGDGEILMRGPSLMRGYHGRTDSPIDANGWLHTGDLGTLDAEGNLSIVGRKKEIIITAGGKNVSPAKIEAELKAAGPAIAHACAVGDRRPYLTALLVLEPGADERAVQQAVAAANTRLARVEQIKRYTVLRTEWRPGGAELTPTQKLKRRSVLTRYATEIEAMYVGVR